MNMHKNTRLTPSLDLDILNGIMRQAVLQQPQTYLGADTIIETHITRDMLEHAEEIRLSNALRGVFEADLVYQEQSMISRKWIKPEGDYSLDGLSV